MFFFKKNCHSRPLFVYFRLFHITQLNELMKTKMVCLGLEPGAAGRKAQMNPLSYGGTPYIVHVNQEASIYNYNYLFTKT